LKNGEFDEKLGLEGVFETPPALTPEPPTAPVPLGPVVPPLKVEAATAFAQAAPPQTDIPKKQQSLDDLIFDFLSAGDERH
jgi:hypothetical protein